MSHNQHNICCPICSKQNSWNPRNVFRPFCSERCKRIDLGEWASGNRKIPCTRDDGEEKM
ncbi:MAG: DNA gyrase inhibitor YacG [Legionella sp.]|nr:DNA gyrase inhibitor YacG [Legionella sp.]